MYLCFYTYPKTKVEQSQSNTISFYLLIVRKSTIVYFSACELLHNCYMVVFLFTQTQNLNNHIVMPFPVILRLPRSEQQVFSFTQHCSDIVIRLSFCLPKHKNRTIRMLSHFLFRCFNKYNNTKVGQSEYNTIYFYSYGDVIRLFSYLPKDKSEQSECNFIFVRLFL
jgi:hypothetical protein